uniref:HTH cro/C1-type domain-containing protein n=1 Tax=viral metagenome TaxID=1070528 RepID=A0A6C0EMG0_9ZZZZ
MEHQDWKPVVLKKAEKPVHIEHKSGFKQHKNLDSNDPDAPKTIDLETARRIQQARMEKKLTQKQLAQRINVKPALIQSYEQGKAIPDHAVLNKITRTLGIKLKNKTKK